MEKGLAFDNPFIMGTVPIESMYGPLYRIFVYMYDKNKPNATKYIATPKSSPTTSCETSSKTKQRGSFVHPCKNNLKITLPNLYFGVPCEFSGA